MFLRCWFKKRANFGIFGTLKQVTANSPNSEHPNSGTFSIAELNFGVDIHKIPIFSPNSGNFFDTLDSAIWIVDCIH
jgi:hypothetical protein